MPNSQRPVIDLGKQLLATTLPKYLTGGAVIVALTIGWTEVATTSDVDAKFTTLAEAQTVTAKQVQTLADAQKKTDGRMKLIVRLVSAQYVEHVDAEEHRTSGRHSQVMSRKAKRVAAALQVDPNDPLAGLELFDVD